MAPAAPIRARIDPGERLVNADEPLAALQLRCGGVIPGVIAIPALLDLVRKARRRRLPLARTIAAYDDGRMVSAWAEVTPDDAGADLSLSRWRSDPSPETGASPLDRAGSELDLVRHLAEGQALLDAQQQIRYVEVQAADLREFERAAQTNLGRRWTEFVTFDGLQAQAETLHWRLLDGATLTVAGSTRAWIARLAPVPSGGFELFLLPGSIDALPLDLPPAAIGRAPLAGDAVYHALLARELGPSLRQPISRIIANAETIRTRLGGPLADEYSGYAADIADAARHLLGLVDDLADLDAVESTDFAASADPIDLADCAIRAGGLLSVRAGRRNIAIAVPAREPVVPAVGEFRRVLQILLNLVSNAINYAPEGTQVTLTGGVDDEAAWIAVTDQGPGLTAAQAARVFDKFERLGRSNDGGSGLGLYISRRLARAMGGDLSVSATPGEGARFVLSLPSRDLPSR